MAPANWCSLVLPLRQLGIAPQNPGGRRRFPSVVTARRGGVAADAGTQPLLQGLVELDRLSPSAGRLRTRRARARCYHLERMDADRIVDRRTHVLFRS